MQTTKSMKHSTPPPPSFLTGMRSKSLGAKYSKRGGTVFSSALSRSVGNSLALHTNQKRTGVTKSVSRQKLQYSSKTITESESVSRLTNSYKQLKSSVKDLKKENERLVC